MMIRQEIHEGHEDSEFKNLMGLMFLPSKKFKK